MRFFIVKMDLCFGMVLVNVGNIVVKQDCLVRDFGIQLFDKTYETSVKKLCGIESESFKLMKLEDYEDFQIIF